MNEFCCGEKLKIAKTTAVNGGCRVQLGICPKCKSRFTLVSMVVARVEKRGDGMHAWATKLKQGKAELT